MLLQRGNFLVNNINELDSLKQNPKDEIKRVINLDYMGKLEFEGNTIPFLRMIIELYKDEYRFYHLNIFNANNEQMIMYVNFENKSDENENIKTCNIIAHKYINGNYSLYEHINRPDETLTNFWWDIEYNCMIFFGSEKIDIINYFIDSSFKRDGGKKEIEKKLIKAGYKI